MDETEADGDQYFIILERIGFLKVFRGDGRNGPSGFLAYAEPGEYLGQLLANGRRVAFKEAAPRLKRRKGPFEWILRARTLSLAVLAKKESKPLKIKLVAADPVL